MGMNEFIVYVRIVLKFRSEVKATSRLVRRASTSETYFPRLRLDFGL